MRSIDIRTTQNVTIEYELASLRERFFAYFIDSLIVYVSYYFIAILVTTVLVKDVLDDGLVGYALFALFPLAAFILYQLLSEIFADGQSWGKKAMGIKVVRLDGEEPSLSDYLLRATFHLVDTVLSAGVVAALFISSSARRQRLGDMTANTTVIRIKVGLRFKLEDILKINTLENYEPQYPEVRQLSEQDMLLIKNVISRHRTYPNDAHRKVVNNLVNHLKEQLDLIEIPRDRIGFLKTLIRDYIVLTR